MLRIALRSSSVPQRVRYFSSIHDTVIAGLVGSGVPREMVYGREARAFSIAPEKFSCRKGFIFFSGITVGTTDPELARWLLKLDKDAFRITSEASGDTVDMSGWDFDLDLPPVVPGVKCLAVLMASPLLLSNRVTRRWITDLHELENPSSALSEGISTRSGRPVELTVELDEAYMEASGDHSFLVPLKRNLKGGRDPFVIGTLVPMLLHGDEMSLVAAWCLGIGEKTRMGFGGLRTTG